MSTFLCGPSIYHFKGWDFELHKYGGPWPLRQDVSHRLRAGPKFWRVWEEFNSLSPAKREKHLRHQGGCIQIGGNK